MEKVPYLGHTLTRWQVGSSTFLALPERGARLMNWHVTHGDGSLREVIYWPELTSIDEFTKARGGNPVLFPFNARCFDEGQIHFWRSPDGVRRPMPMHGIARQSTFEVTRLDGRGFAAQLIPNDETRAAYPYDFEFTVTYRFEPLVSLANTRCATSTNSPSRGAPATTSISRCPGAKACGAAITSSAFQQPKPTGKITATASCFPDKPRSAKSRWTTRR